MTKDEEDEKRFCNLIYCIVQLKYIEVDLCDSPTVHLH